MHSDHLRFMKLGRWDNPTTAWNDKNHGSETPTNESRPVSKTDCRYLSMPGIFSDFFPAGGINLFPFISSYCNLCDDWRKCTTF